MEDGINAIELATELTVAWLSNPNTRTTPDDVPAFLRSMHDAVAALASPAPQSEGEGSPVAYEPAVSVRKSLASPDHIISMIDGKPYKTLRRHLSTNGLTPEEYRQRYNLKSDYPMVAASYSEARRAMAKTIGLGRKPGQKAKEETFAPTSTAAPKTPRKRAKAATAQPTKAADGAE